MSKESFKQFAKTHPELAKSVLTLEIMNQETVTRGLMINEY